MYKLYLVSFTLNSDGIYCLKPGITSYSNVEKRFSRAISDGIIKNFKIWTSGWVINEDTARFLENNLQDKVKDKFGGYKHPDGEIRFHNFFTLVKYNGITEMRKFDKDEKQYIFDYITENTQTYDQIKVVR